MENFFSLLNISPTITDSKDAKDLEITNGEIEFENVSFSYHTQTDNILLNNISFKVKKGETLAIVGPSGTGKKNI
jgi:ABC-type multidrug transport system fused ATPase/permease subunit